jgi:hypothetical protein
MAPRGGWDDSCMPVGGEECVSCGGGTRCSKCKTRSAVAPHGGSDDSGVPVGEEECISCGGLGGWGMDVSPRYDGRH